MLLNLDLNDKKPPEGGLSMKGSYFNSLKSCWRQASYKITAVAFDKFKLREFGAIGKRIQK